MAITKQGFSGVIEEVDSTFRAARVTIRPQEVLFWGSAGLVSGALTGVAASAPIFALRNVGTNLIIIRRLNIGFTTTTAFTTAQNLAYQLFVARNWTVNDSGGNTVSFTGSNTKHRTSLATPTSLFSTFCSLSALTAGTRTLDANSVGIAGAGSTGLASSMPQTPLLSHDPGDYPIVLAQNEGIVVTNNTLMGAAGVIQLMLNVELAEVTAY